MAKSKQVKQAEALARKRTNYNWHLKEVTEHRYACNWDTTNPALRDAEARFKKYLDEAQLDEAGNPVFIYELDKRPAFSTAGTQRISLQNKQFVGRLNRPNARSILEYLDTGISK